jgi:16S rRNA G966 N2-methylase RsmD
MDATAFLEKLLADGYAGKVDLIYTDPPWGCMKTNRGKSILESDKIYTTDIQRVCECMAKLLSEKGNDIS